MPENIYRKMKIGFASRYDPRDKKTWSGIGYFTLQQLKQYGEVEIFQYPLPKWLQEWHTTQKSINRRWFKKNTATEFLTSYAKYFSRKLTADLKKRPVDVLFVMASSQMIAYVKTDIPIIYMTDATFQQLQGYYHAFNNLADYNIRRGIALDKKAFQNASHCMLSSQWCAQSTIKDYGIAENKISVVHMGANLDAIPERAQIDFEPKPNRCNLLFLAVEWERKGGDIALEIFRRLKQQGVSVHLHIIGCVPPHQLSDEKNITNIPFLNKNKKEDFHRLHEILLQTDFLVLPTRAECAGIVYSEAAAYGIPSITTNTGGIGDCVQDGVTGFTLPLSATATDYAELIVSILNSTDKQKSLKLAARNYFEMEMNWNKWGSRFFEIAQNLISSKR